jgi:NAD(P)-dependent dehydrogenase (short-subunit alcohol dehydrogenase family)
MSIKKIFNIQNKNIIIAGSNSGIGKKLSERLKKLKANIIRIDKHFTSNLKSDDYICDVTDQKKLKKIFQNIKKKYKKINGMVNCVGITLTSKNPYNDQNSFDETIEVNLKGAFNLCSNYCLNLNSTNSSVINITSLGANQAFPKNPSYQASKSGLKQLTKAFALDFANKKIRFNSICPGYIKTKMTKKSYSDISQRNNRTSRMMMKRWGNVDDILGGVIYLLSDSSSYVTGTELTIDGGWLNKGL